MPQLATKATGLRAIDPAPFLALAGELPDCDLDKRPKLRWLKISELEVDPSYQRDLGPTGRKNILKIARDFDWSKFAPVVVAPLAADRYAIVDGQHRTTAAAIRGIRDVPCQIVELDRAGQAAAFAAINAVVTEMSPMQLHAAKLIAGDPEAKALAKVCTEAGVTILRYPVQSKNQKVGETMSAGALYRLLTKFGKDVLATALSCITRTRDGYPGLLRSQLISAFCVVLEAEPAWCESPKLLKAVGTLDLRQTFERACRDAKAGSGGGIVAPLVDIISEHLEGALGAAAA